MSSSKIKNKALESGFTACGIIPVSAYYKEAQKYWDKRVKTFPGSKDIYEWFCPAPPPEDGKSIIVCTLRYNKYKAPDYLAEYMPKVLLTSDLHPKNDAWEYPVKTAFEKHLKAIGINIVEFHLPNRWAAAKAGLGKFGRNNFIYDPEHGSYIWIEAWVVDRELEYDPMPDNIYLPECGEGCQKCIQACPTKAFSGEFSMNIKKCIEFLSWHTDTPLSKDEMKQMGTLLCGCDICQDVCPCNKNKFDEGEEIPQLTQIEEYLKLENILMMDEDTYINHFCPRFYIAGKDDLWKWKRNAIRAMVNSGEGKYYDIIKSYCKHEDARIREMAQWGCSMLK